MIVIAVVRSYYRRNGRSYPHSKRWRVLYYDDNGKFRSKYLHGRLEAWIWKRKIQKIRTHVCEYCGLKYRSNKKGCPKCE